DRSVLLGVPVVEGFRCWSTTRRTSPRSTRWRRRRWHSRCWPRRPRTRSRPRRRRRCVRPRVVVLLISMSRTTRSLFPVADETTGFWAAVTVLAVVGGEEPGDAVGVVLEIAETVLQDDLN